MIVIEFHILIELTDCLGGIMVQGAYRTFKTHNIQTGMTNTRRKLIPASGIRKLFDEKGFTRKALFHSKSPKAVSVKLLPSFKSVAFSTARQL